MTLRGKVGKIGHATTSAVLNRYPRIAFIHIPKSAGCSVRDSLFDAIYPAALSATRAYCKIDARVCTSAASTLGLDVMGCRQAVLIHALSDPMARFVTGHVFANPKVVEQFREWKFVTVLREPAARFISTYVFHRYKPLLPATIDCDFADFLETERARYAGSIVTQYFSGMSESELEARPEAAIAAGLDNLERFFSVGFVDDLENWAERIGRALGRTVRIRRKNPTPRPEIWTQLGQSPELRARVQELCAIDLQFYAAAQTRFKEKANGRAASLMLEEPAAAAL